MRLNDEQRRLVEDNMKLAYFMAHKLRNHTSLEFEDLVGVCMRGLCKAALKFEPDMGNKFSTFATTVMQNEVFIANRQERKNVPTVCLEEIFDGKSDLKWESIISADQRLMDDAITSSITISSAFADLLPKLKERDKALVSLAIENPEITQREMSNVLMISQGQISRDMKRIQKQIQKRMAL